MFPSICGALDHGQSGIVLQTPSAMVTIANQDTHELVVFDIQENQFWPQVYLFRGPDDLIPEIQLKVQHFECRTYFRNVDP